MAAAALTASAGLTASAVLTADDRRDLLADAREAIAARLERRAPRWRARRLPPQGAFVTLRERGALRGCIGRMASPAPLDETTRAMAVEAAFGDPRFPPLRPEELPGVVIEISALTPFEPCPDPRSVTVGVHGLYLVHRGRSGVLLPQVPVEQGWDRDEFLAYLCVKAGLPPRSWEAPGSALFTFRAEVFGEGS